MSTPSSETPAAAELPPNQVGSTAGNTSASPGEGGPANESSQPSGLQRLREWLDRLLVADVFLVLSGALWFAVAVVLHSQGVETPLATFQKLWEPLFTPAIGLLMAAALLSGALGWWQRRGQR
jgi:hypothetical protein